MSKQKEVVYCHTYTSPVGDLHLAVDRRGRILRVSFVELEPWDTNIQFEVNKYACGELELQLDEYFNGTRTSFSLETRVEGTDFQRSVWKKLRKLPYGSRTTYGELAARVGRARAARAVGNAVAENPVCILIPCHRVVPSSGGVGKYGARHIPLELGRDRKRYLLSLERQPDCDTPDLFAFPSTAAIA
ncbi:MAG: methylated-DNA--[protein]-cysteine S-methyltransferase [Spirochaetaceae bacterium]